MDLHEIKRKHFRISLKGNDAVTVKINNIQYDVIDLNDVGIGILLSPEDILVTEGDVLSMELTIENMVQTLQGKIAHISYSVPEEILCGIKFMNIDPKTKKKLDNFLLDCRKKFFKEE